MPDLLATEQLAHGVGIAMGDDDQAANGVGVDPLRDELEAIAHKLAQRAAERLAVSPRVLSAVPAKGRPSEAARYR